MSATVLGLKATSSIAWRSIGEALRDGILHFSGRSSDDLYEDQVLGAERWFRRAKTASTHQRAWQN